MRGGKGVCGLSRSRDKIGKVSDILNIAQPIVESLALRFVSQYPQNGVSYEDLVQEGRLAILEGFNRYKERKRGSIWMSAVATWVYACVSTRFKAVMQQTGSDVVTEESDVSDENQDAYSDYLEAPGSLGTAAGASAYSLRRQGVSRTVRRTSVRIMQLQNEVSMYWSRCVCRNGEEVKE